MESLPSVRLLILDRYRLMYAHFNSCTVSRIFPKIEEFHFIKYPAKGTTYSGAIDQDKFANLRKFKFVNYQ